MPTKDIKDVRGYMDVAYLFIDEADHFDKSIQEELKPAITAYEEKSKGKTIMVSSPNAPGGLFERIENDPNSKYKKLFLGYELGLGKIYDPEYIAQKKLEPEFEREYNLKYLGKVGNVFSPSQIDKAIELGEQSTLWIIPINDYTLHSVGVDVGFGSSNLLYGHRYIKSTFYVITQKVAFCIFIAMIIQIQPLYRATLLSDIPRHLDYNTDRNNQ